MEEKKCLICYFIYGIKYHFKRYLAAHAIMRNNGVLALDIEVYLNR